MAVIFPGDVLCLPIPIFFLCLALLHPTPSAPGAQGAILVRQLANGRQSATVVAVDLSNSAVFGNFDAYGALILIEGIGGFGFLLTLVPAELPTWAGTTVVPRPLFYAGALITVFPTNTQTGAEGSPVLAGNLLECARPVEI